MWYNRLMHSRDNKPFSQWLLDEITDRRLSYVEVAKRGNISHARISQVISGESPGEKFCQGIARAFDLPVDYVFRLAGILPEEPELDHNTQVALGLFRNLSPEEQDRILAIMRAFATMEELKDNTKGE